jgi:hypothetical protein
LTGTDRRRELAAIAKGGLGHPLRLLGAFLPVVFFATRLGRCRRRDRRKYRKVVRDLGINRQKILSREFSWYTNTVELKLAFVLPRTSADSRTELEAAAKGIGFKTMGVEHRRAHVRRRTDRLPRRVWYRSVPGQSEIELAVAFVDAGEAMPSVAGAVVPALHTGILLSLHARSSQ